MNPYLAILSSRFRTLLQYRSAAFAGVATQVFFGLVRMMIFEAFYRSSTISQPMSQEQTITYIWVGQAAIVLVLFGVDKEIAEMIRTGSIAYEMTRPLDLYSLWFMRAVSGLSAPFMMRSIPILFVATLFFGSQLPVSPEAALLFVISIGGSVMLAGSLVVLLTISLLWTISGEGISRLAPAAIFFFSGILIPLPFFPDWMQSVIAVLPFRGLIDTPIRIFIGDLSISGGLFALLQQAVWICVFIAIGRFILARGVRRLIIQGG
jgi:ABC-2 type transport system permease protein